MKILLIQPRTPPVSIAGDDWFVFEPLALEYVAAGVVDDHDVKILDLRFEPTLEDSLARFRPDIVGLTAYTVHVNSVRHICESIKERDPQTVTVVGGHHASIQPGDFLSPSIDAIVVGEGVFPFREIVRRLVQRQALNGIPGVVIPSLGAHAPGSNSRTVDLDALPQPARQLTLQYRSQYYCDWMKPLASIRTSMGCPHRCNFCALWKLAGGKYLTRSPESIVSELGGIEEEYVFFADDESLLDARRMTALAGLIRDAGIRKKYFLYARSDTISRNPDLLEAWRRIGLTRVFVGLESCKDEDLEFVAKGSTMSDNERALRILHDLEVSVYGSFILRPEAKRRDFEELRRYCRVKNIDYPTFAVLTPLPGTELYEERKAELITDNYDYFDFIHTLLPTSIPLRDYEHYEWLIRTVLTPGKRLALLRQFPLRDAAALLGKAVRIQRGVKNAWKDYEDSGVVR